MSADLVWDEGREKWEGEAPAEPKLIGKSAGRKKNGSGMATGD